MTNGDKLRKMSDEEIAHLLCLPDCSTAEFECPGWRAEHGCEYDCEKYFLEWLREEAASDENR